MSAITIFGAIDQGLIFAILALGLFITFRILDLPDLTVDGSFVTGLAVSGMMCLQGHPFLGLFLSLLAGFIAGSVTGLLHTKLKINAILSGILTMTALYSINFRIMGLKPSIILYNKTTVFTFIDKNLMVNNFNLSKGLMICVINIILIFLLNNFLKTRLGLALRATGDNESMMTANSVNTDFMKILAFALCNSLVSLSGAIYIQYNQQSSYTVGTGMLVLSIASIIIGEAIFSRKTIFINLISVVLGAVVYRIFIAFAFQLGLAANDLKIFSAFIVIIAISLSKMKLSVCKNFSLKVSMRKILLLRKSTKGKGVNYD